MRLTLRKNTLWLAALLTLLSVWVAIFPASTSAASDIALFNEAVDACSFEVGGEGACQAGFRAAAFHVRQGPLIACDSAGFTSSSKYRQACIDGANRGIAAAGMSNYQLKVCGKYLKGYVAGANNLYFQRLTSCMTSTPKTAPKKSASKSSKKPASQPTPKKPASQKPSAKKSSQPQSSQTSQAAQSQPASSTSPPPEDPAIKCDHNNCDLIAKYVNPAIDLFSLCFGLIAVISLIAGGIQYSASQGDPQKTAMAKSRITNTILAIFAYLFLWTFLQFLVPGGAFH